MVYIMLVRFPKSRRDHCCRWSNPADSNSDKWPPGQSVLLQAAWWCYGIFPWSRKAGIIASVHQAQSGQHSPHWLLNDLYVYMQSAGKACCPISLACPWTWRLWEHRSTRPLEPPGLDFPSSPYLSKTFVAYLQVSAMSTYYKTIISLVYNTFITYNILYYITRYITMIYSTVIYHVISRLYYITCDLAMLYISKFKFMLYIIQFMTCHIAY